MYTITDERSFFIRSECSVGSCDVRGAYCVQVGTYQIELEFVEPEADEDSAAVHFLVS